MVLQNVHQLIFHETSYSFPSGHAAFFAALAMVVFLYNRKAGWIYFSAALFIGFARIYTGVHWPLDVLGGLILGAVIGFAVDRLTARLKKI